ncbi:SymE family type I addiction module toxin [Sodalis sp. dw_96]|uniref:SymE family type I addiction module toxin n=1 Tax=Sodalis sp. dw_96 TaxID=2719794 RepID=UPI001BD59C63|nr:SymE family type I addiction module toxin [Sodalis sp. dw_96]
MAKQNVKAICRHTQGDFSDRRYIVGYVPNGGRDNPSPAIYLGGRWLEACGFLTGQYVTVSAEPGQLIIQPAPSS